MILLTKLHFFLPWRHYTLLHFPKISWYWGYTFWYPFFKKKIKHLQMGAQHADLSATYFTLLIRAKKISGRDTGMVKDNNLENKILLIIAWLILLMCQQNLLSGWTNLLYMFDSGCQWGSETRRDKYCEKNTVVKLFDCMFLIYTWFFRHSVGWMIFDIVPKEVKCLCRKGSKEYIHSIE